MAYGVLGFLESCGSTDDAEASAEDQVSVASPQPGGTRTRSESEEGNAMKDSQQTCVAKLARGRIMSEHRNKQLPRVSTSCHYIPSGISEVIGR